MITQRLVVPFIVLLLAACNSSSNKTEESEPVVDVPPPAPYMPPPPGEIKNQAFKLNEQGRIEHWSLVQHSSNPSYTLQVDAGVATITRTGVEPWGVLRQVIRSRDAKPFIGKTLEFSADISGELTDEYGEPMNPPGITARIRGVKAGDPPMFGRTNLVTESTPLLVESGSLPWQRYAVRFDVPAADEASSVDIELNILMTTGGVMRVRGPSLVVVDE